MADLVKVEGIVATEAGFAAKLEEPTVAIVSAEKVADLKKFGQLGTEPPYVMGYTDWVPHPNARGWMWSPSAKRVCSKTRLRDEAQAVYRDTWMTYGVVTTFEEAAECERIMDRVQPYCSLSSRPDREWFAFLLSLPTNAKNKLRNEK